MQGLGTLGTVWVRVEYAGCSSGHFHRNLRIWLPQRAIISAISVILNLLSLHQLHSYWTITIGPDSQTSLLVSSSDCYLIQYLSNSIKTKWILPLRRAILPRANLSSSWTFIEMKEGKIPVSRFKLGPIAFLKHWTCYSASRFYIANVLLWKKWKIAQMLFWQQLCWLSLVRGGSEWKHFCQRYFCPTRVRAG